MTSETKNMKSRKDLLGEIGMLQRAVDAAAPWPVGEDSKLCPFCFEFIEVDYNDEDELVALGHSDDCIVNIYESMGE